MGCGSGKRRNDDYDESKGKGTGSSNDEALRILGTRLAKGEITKDEYSDLRKVIEGEEKK
jgi:uncharacterized membrane protein